MRRAVELDADFMAAYMALAEIYFGTQQPDRAIDTYKKVTERSPDDFVAFRIDRDDRGGPRTTSTRRPSTTGASSPSGPTSRSRPTTSRRSTPTTARATPRRRCGSARTWCAASPTSPASPTRSAGSTTAAGSTATRSSSSSARSTNASKRGGDNSLYRWHLGAALAKNGDKAAARRELQKSLGTGRAGAGSAPSSPRPRPPWTRCAARWKAFKAVNSES